MTMHIGRLHFLKNGRKRITKIGNCEDAILQGLEERKQGNPNIPQPVTIMVTQRSNRKKKQHKPEHRNRKKTPIWILKKGGNCTQDKLDMTKKWTRHKETESFFNRSTKLCHKDQFMKAKSESTTPYSKFSFCREIENIDNNLSRLNKLSKKNTRQDKTELKR